MQRLEVSGAVRLIYRSLGVKGLNVQFQGQRVKCSDNTESRVDTWKSFSTSTGYPVSSAGFVVGPKYSSDGKTRNVC